MRHLPSWFPGTYPATQARQFRAFVDKIHDYPFEDIQKQMVSFNLLWIQTSELIWNRKTGRRRNVSYPLTWKVCSVKGTIIHILSEISRVQLLWRTRQEPIPYVLMFILNLNIWIPTNVVDLLDSIHIHARYGFVSIRSSTSSRRNRPIRWQK